MNALTFNKVTLNPIDQNDNQIWLTAADLAKALDYSRTDKITQIYNRNKSEFTNSMTQIISNPQNPNLRLRVFSLRGCHLLAMFARTDVAKDFRIWVLDILDKEVGAPVIQTEQLSTVKDRNGLVKAARMAQKRLGLGYDETFNLIHHRFNVDRIGDLTVNQVGAATEYIQHMMLSVITNPYRGDGKAELQYHYRNNERLVSQADAQGNLWTRPLADHEFVVSTLSLPQFIHDCNDLELPQLTALSFAVSKKMVEAQAWSNVVMVCNTGEQP